MARRSTSTIQEELYSTPDESAREEFDDARLLDLDAEKESPFLRAQKRVPARRSPLPKKTTTRVVWACGVIVVAALGAIAASAAYHYGEHSWRFRLNSSDDIEMTGLNNVTRAQVIEVMGGDIGRNIFYIPLEQRRKQIEQIPWVESASVMRFSPNRIRIELHERTPVAFARVGSRIQLVDAGGVLMELSSRKKYSFPVVAGMSAGEPLSARAAKMKIYDDMVRTLDASGAHYSQDLSEVDVSDPEDVRMLTNDPDGAVLVHFGSGNYLDQFKLYAAHLREWRQQYQKVDSVDLRYWESGQVVVNPDLRGIQRQPVSVVAAKAAMAAGVKPSVLVQRTPVKPAHVVPVSHVAKKRSAKPAHAIKYAVLRKPDHAAKKPPARRSGQQQAHGLPANEPARTQSSLSKPSPAIVKGATGQ